MGRTLDNAVSSSICSHLELWQIFFQLLNLGLKQEYKGGVKKLGFNMEDLLEQERDAALGNGGLGRLAACYLDSGASQELPLWGYGLRYKYGIFQQLISPTGEQLEVSSSVQSPSRYNLLIINPTIGSRPLARPSKPLGIATP